MKIKKFNEEISENNKFYVYSVPYYSETYRGSVWDDPRKPWIPDDAKLISEFEISRVNDGYMIVNQQELYEINKIKNDRKIKDSVKKYNL